MALFDAGGGWCIYDPYRFLQELDQPPFNEFFSEPPRDTRPWPHITGDDRAVRAWWPASDGIPGAVVSLEGATELVSGVARNQWLTRFCQQVPFGVYQVAQTPALSNVIFDSLPSGIAEAGRNAVERAYWSASEPQTPTEDNTRDAKAIDRALRVASALSLAREEGQRISGRLVIPHRATSPEHRLGIEVSPNDMKLIGKLLLAAGPNMELVLPFAEGLGALGYRAFCRDAVQERDVRVEIDASGEATVLQQNLPLAVYRGGQLFGTSARSEQTSCLLALGNHYHYTSPVNRILNQMKSLLELCDHGYSIVIHDPADEHLHSARRLGIPVTPALSISEGHGAQVKAASMASVDGALFMSQEGKVHAFGCLLDGAPCGNESRARGSRYNSALRYSAEHKGSVVLVGSSDGGVTLVARGQQVYPTRVFIPPNQVMDGSYDTRVLDRETLQALRAGSGQVSSDG